MSEFAIHISYHVIIKQMNANPEQIVFFKQYCKKHSANAYDYVCDQENCDYYLSFECFQCRQDNVESHSHQCPKSVVFVKKLHSQVIANLTKAVRHHISTFQHALQTEINQLINCLEYWYSPMDETTTEKQFVHTVENPSKWAKIMQTSDLKDNLINARLKEISNKFRRQLQQITNVVGQEMSQLKYRPAPLEWKFDKTNTHELLNISGFKDRTVDKKSQKQKYCVALLNQPLTPMKSEVTFTLNSQNPYDHFIILGVGSKRQLAKDFYETDLKKGIYAIYQAAKSGNSNNALSLHNNDDSMHYKQAVGWNFRSGDSIVITYTVTDFDKVRIQFKKRKQTFELFVKKQNAFVHPFAALFSSGDKVSLDFT